jgi:hypothetical protein
MERRQMYISSSYIYFTKFDTVKTTQFEVTNKNFFDSMNKLIYQNSNEYKVLYDEEEDKYIIYYKNQKYYVKDGKEDLSRKNGSKELLEELDKLVEKCKEIEKIKEEENNKVEATDVEVHKIYKRIRENGAKTYKERVALLDRLKNNKDFTNPFDEAADIYDEINDGGNFCGEVRHGLFFCLAVLSAITAAFVPFFGWVALGFTLLGVDGLLTMFLFDNYFDFAGLFPFLCSIVIFPFTFGYYTIKRIVEKIIQKIKISSVKKQIKQDEMQMKNKKALDNLKMRKINVEELSNLFQSKLKEEPGDLNKTYEMVNELKNNILSFKDEKTKKKYVSELFEIIKYYIDASKHVSIKQKTINNFFDQIKDLKIKVEEELRKEKEKGDINNEYDNLVEKINYQKSIGTR